MSLPNQKPYVLICATPIYGHMMPIRAIAKDLVERGFDVTFLTGSVYKDLIESIGASFEPLQGACDFTEGDFDKLWPERENHAPGPAQLAYDMEHIFIGSIPSQYESIQRALKKINFIKEASRPVVMVCEMAFIGAAPMLLGAPGLRPDASLGIGIVPLVISSIDHPPFGPGLPPDSSPEGREKNIAAYKSVYEVVFKASMDRYRTILSDLGAKPSPDFFFDASIKSHDRFLQMRLPSVEYPRSDLPDTVKFAGGLPRGKRDPWTNPPEWWDEVAINKDNRRIIAVSQGSIATNFSDLVIPTMTALQDVPNTLVIVALGKKGAALPPETIIPHNARVLDFIPFDDLLPHCDVFVTNGGYGGFQHAISHGTPLVIAGASEDKPEVAARAEWAGVAVNLRTGTPTVDDVRRGILQVLLSPEMYKKRAMELEQEMSQYDPLGVIAETVEELAAGAKR